MTAPDFYAAIIEARDAARRKSAYLEPANFRSRVLGHFPTAREELLLRLNARLKARPLSHPVNWKGL